MDFITAVQRVGVGLAFEIFLKAGRLESVTFAEWCRVAPLVFTKEPRRAPHNRMRYEEGLESKLVFRILETPKGFDDKCAALSYLIDQRAADDSSDALISAKYNLLESVVYSAKSSDEVERVQSLLDRAALVWSTTLAERYQGRFRLVLREKALATARTFEDWHNIARRYERDYPEWQQAIEMMVGLAADTLDHWVSIHDESWRTRSWKRVEQALAKLAELSTA